MSEENTVLPLLGIDGDDKMKITIEPQIHHMVAKVKFDKSVVDQINKEIDNVSLANAKSNDNNLKFAANLSFTLGFFITYQALIHIMVNTGLAPTKGMGLPFISYGGTNLLMMFIFIGLLTRIQIENRQKISHAVKRGY